MTDEKTLLWDWNGTLLDDVEICIESINVLLIKYDLPKITKIIYQKIFSFPVEEYYKNLGFDFSRVAFSTLAKEFYAEYLPRLPECGLFPEVESLLQHFKNKGFRQLIISAMEQGELRKLVKKLGINAYFEEIYGLSNLHAVSKLQMVKNVIHNHQINIDCSWIIGDTKHDFHVAHEINCKHVLIAQGHQDYSRLSSVSNNVISSLEFLKNVISY
jgi:phosphoglycolate phosphatase